MQVKDHSMALALSQHRLTIALKFSVVAVSVVALYFQDLSMVFTGALTDESTFHILAIPFLFAFLVYRKRRLIGASLLNESNKGVFQRNFSSLVGISLCAVSILTYWYGSYSFTPLEYHMFTLPFMAAGLVLLLFNVKMLKELLFPVAFLVFLAPPPSEVLYGVGSMLANLNAIASNSLANILNLHSTLTSSNVGPVISIIRPDTSVLSFNVSVACSGIYSIIGFVIFALFIAYITVGKLRNKLLILVMGVPLIVFLNIVRITTILGIGYYWGEDLALQVFHSVGATVLMFVGTLILLAVSEKAFKKPPPTLPCVACNNDPKNPTEQFCSACGKLFKYPKAKWTKLDIVKISGIILVLIALLSIQAPVFALTQSPGQVMVQTPSGTVVTAENSMFPSIDGYTVRYSHRDTAYEGETGNDAALVYVYNPMNKSQSTIWVATQIGSSSTSQHRWETCLVNYPLSQGDAAKVKQLDLRDIQLQDNPPIRARYFAFQYTDKNETDVVLYWYQTATFNINGTSETKSVMISLIAYPTGPSGVAAAEDLELQIAKSINSYWQPIKAWSTVSLAISQNGLVLSFGVTGVLVALIIYAFYLDSREKLSLLTLYRKLPTRDQLLLNAVNNSKGTSTQAIVSEFQRLSAASVLEVFVVERLEEAEKLGLVKRIVKNNRDSPLLLWKSRLSTQGSVANAPFASFKLPFFHK